MELAQRVSVTSLAATVSAVLTRAGESWQASASRCESSGKAMPGPGRSSVDAGKGEHAWLEFESMNYQKSSVTALLLQDRASLLQQVHLTVPTLIVVSSRDDGQGALLNESSHSIIQGLVGGICPEGHARDGRELDIGGKPVQPRQHIGCVGCAIAVDNLDCRQGQQGRAVQQQAT